MNKQQRHAKEKRYLERQQKKMTEDGAKLAIDVLGVIPVYVLHEAFGFGHDRLTKYILEYQRIMTAVIKDQVKLDTLAEIVNADTGLRHDDGAWYDEGRKRRL